MFKKKRKWALCLILSALSALLLSTGFPGFHFPTQDIWYLIPIACVPLFVVLFLVPSLLVSNQDKKIKIKIIFYSFIIVWFFGLIFQLLCFSWILKPLLYFSSLSELIAYPLLVIISLLTGLFFPILFLPIILSSLWRVKQWQKVFWLFSLAAVLTLFEIIIPRFFNWSFACFLSSNLNISQLSSLFGFNTGSFVIFYSNLLITDVIVQKIEHNLKIKTILWQRTGSFLILWLSVYLFGSWRISSIEKNTQSEQSARVAFVQPNFVFNSVAFRSLPSKDTQSFSFSRMLEMSRDALKKAQKTDGRSVDLLVWPEGAAPDFLTIDPTIIDVSKKFSTINQLPILAQSIGWNANINIKSQVDFSKLPIWSVSVLIDRNGIQKERYEKWVPMPFGESVPLENWFPKLGEWYRFIFTNASLLQIGNSYNALQYAPQFYVAPLICFDSIAQELPYLQSKKGKASFFVNQANFIWMVDSNAGLEFSVLDKMRAIENERSILLVANTGPSIAFSTTGRQILPTSTLLTQKTGFVDLPISKNRSLFSYVYYWPLVAIGLLSLFYLIHLFYLQAKQK